MIDLGSGTPLVLVPGIQGRWEWMRPTVEALARHFRVLSFSLAGERTSRHPFDRRPRVRQLRRPDRPRARGSGRAERGDVRRVVRRPGCRALRSAPPRTCACARARVGARAGLHARRPRPLLLPRAVAAEPPLLRQRVAPIAPRSACGTPWVPRATVVFRRATLARGGEPHSPGLMRDRMRLARGGGLRLVCGIDRCSDPCDHRRGRPRSRRPSRPHARLPAAAATCRMRHLRAHRPHRGRHASGAVRRRRGALRRRAPTSLPASGGPPRKVAGRA